MTIAANAYAIGPGLHDWEREREDKEEMKREAREASFNKEFYWWHINMFCDRNEEKDRKTIIETMSEALSNLYNDNEECERFEFALFLLYYSHDSHEARETIFELLDKHLRKVIRKEWDREREGSGK